MHKGFVRVLSAAFGLALAAAVALNATTTLFAAPDIPPAFAAGGSPN
jgi:hypothetical protein